MKLQLPTVITFARIPPHAKDFMDGFYLRYGCKHQGCKQDPIVQITTNSSSRAACKEHLGETLLELLAHNRQGSKGGFLYRPLRRRGQLEPDAPKVQATSDVVWDASFDNGAASAAVYRTREPDYGVLVVNGGDRELTRETVFLSYGARFGPDVSDVQTWADRALELIDERKPLRQRFDEALQRLEDKEHLLEALLKTAPLTCKAFAAALEVFGNADAAVDFLRSPTSALDGKAPAELLGDEEGLKRVSDLMKAILATRYPLSYPPKKAETNSYSASEYGEFGGPL